MVFSIESSIRTMTDTPVWIIESSASINDGSGAVTVHALTLQQAPGVPLGLLEAWAGELADPRETRSMDDETSRAVAAALIQAQLGVTVDIVTFRIGGGTIHAGEGEDVADLTNGLARLGLARSAALATWLVELPLPVAGPPPQDWRVLGDLLTDADTPFLVAFGRVDGNDRPLVVVLNGAAGIVLWFSQPLQKAIRDHFAERLDSGLSRQDATPMAQSPEGRN